MERIYTIPLRKEFLKAPKYKRAYKATIFLKEFLKKHMKSEEILIGKHLNQEIWKNGPKNPPSKVSVKVVKEGNKVKAELVNHFDETFKEKEIKTEKKTIKEKLTGKSEGIKAPEPETPKAPKEKEVKEKVPSASELKKEKEIKEKKKETKKVPKASELVKKKEKKQ